MQKEVKTLTQLAIEYRVCRKTFRKWIEPIKGNLKLIKGRRLLLSWQVEMIYEFLDKP